jgi:hypothetical protein
MSLTQNDDSRLTTPVNSSPEIPPFFILSHTPLRYCSHWREGSLFLMRGFCCFEYIYMRGGVRSDSLDILSGVGV